MMNIYLRKIILLALTLGMLPSISMQASVAQAMADTAQQSKPNWKIYTAIGAGAITGLIFLGTAKKYWQRTAKNIRAAETERNTDIKWAESDISRHIRHADEEVQEKALYLSDQKILSEVLFVDSPRDHKDAIHKIAGEETLRTMRRPLPSAAAPDKDFAVLQAKSRALEQQYGLAAPKRAEAARATQHEDQFDAAIYNIVVTRICPQFKKIADYNARRLTENAAEYYQHAHELSKSKTPPLGSPQSKASDFKHALDIHRDDTDKGIKRSDEQIAEHRKKIASAEDRKSDAEAKFKVQHLKAQAASRGNKVKACMYGTLGLTALGATAYGLKLAFRPKAY